jgi:hypothetical protein
MSEKKQKTKVSTAETMKNKYDEDIQHKHNKDTLDHRDHQKSHPHTQHGGDPSHNLHEVQTHSDPDSHKHHKTKHHDHKEHTREHHKKS